MTTHISKESASVLKHRFPALHTPKAEATIFITMIFLIIGGIVAGLLSGAAEQSPAALLWTSVGINILGVLLLTALCFFAVSWLKRANTGEHERDGARQANDTYMQHIRWQDKRRRELWQDKYDQNEERITLKDTNKDLYEASQELFAYVSGLGERQTAEGILKKHGVIGTQIIEQHDRYATKVQPSIEGVVS